VARQAIIKPAAAAYLLRRERELGFGAAPRDRPRLTVSRKDKMQTIHAHGAAIPALGFGVFRMSDAAQ
jgi:hypothetical protein